MDKQSPNHYIRSSCSYSSIAFCLRHKGSFCLKVKSLSARETKAILLYLVPCTLRRGMHGPIFQATIINKGYENNNIHI